MSSPQRKIFRLQKLATAIQGLFQRELGEQSYWVKAEIAEISASSSGHRYLSLVEEKDGLRLASMAAVLWKADYEVLAQQLTQNLPSLLQKGQDLVIRVLVDFHPVYGLKLIVKDIDLNYSLGELEKRRQANLKKLEASGRIEANRSLEESPVWQKIALISSAEAAALKDFMQHLSENEFGYRFLVDLYPSKVQGSDAPQSLLKALNKVDFSKYDCLVFIRGGGSSLDLDAFNDLSLCMAILNCPLPVLSGIGHESDWTLVDRVAHTPQKTPTAVADYLLDKMTAFEREINQKYQSIAALAIDLLHTHKLELQDFQNLLKSKPQVILEIQRGYVHQHANGLIRGISSKMKEEEQALDRISESLKHKPLQLIRESYRPALTLVQERIELFAQMQFNQRLGQLDNLKQTLEILSPKQTLKRGFSITRKENQSIRNTENLVLGDQIETELERGKIISEIIKIEKNG